MESKMVKTQLFNSGGVVKWAYFQKKWSIPLSCECFFDHLIQDIEDLCILTAWYYTSFTRSNAEAQVFVLF